MVKKSIVFVVLTLFLFGLFMGIYINTDKTIESAKEKLIRLHVIANSDSPSDQALKLYVRDMVIAKISSRLTGAKDKDAAKSIIMESIDEIEDAAKDAIASRGYSYPVRVALEEASFPTKSYGPLTLPAGTYDALNIKIGEAQGKNWWCVMFPPLCFIDIAHGEASGSSIEELKEQLTEKEYALLVKNECQALDLLTYRIFRQLKR